MKRAASPARLHRMTPHLVSLLALRLAACGEQTGVERTTGTTDVAGSSSGQGTTQAAPTTGSAAPSTGEAPTTGGGTSTGDGSSSEVSGVASVTGEGTSTGSSTGEGSSSEATGDGSSTGDEPPVDLCAQQDDAPPAAGRLPAINDDPAFIQVYVNNIENLKIAGEQCPGDWTDLIFYMKSIEPSPDLFLVQQISDTAQLDTLVQRMNDELPGIFEGFIADGDPWTQGSPCGKEKEKQTNAIILRQGRFSKVGDKHVWQSWANKDGECVRNNQARTRNVMLKLHDKIADRDITVASMHWSTSQGDGPDPACAEKNVAEVDEKLHMKGFGGDMVLFGGDFNETDRNADGGLRPWYAKANGDADGKLNYRDPIYRACKGNGLQACLNDNWTIGGDKRIDMMFAQDGNGCRIRTARAHTITFNEGEAAAEALDGDTDPDLNYSEHRGVRAAFYY